MTVNADLSHSNQELDRVKKGVRKPTVVTLPAGTAVYRFASTQDPNTGSSIPSDRWARGPWWFQEADYRLILEKYHSEGRLGLGTVAASAGAVQPTWSLMDVSIKAVLLDDLNVYIGKGATQYREELPNGMFMTLSGWPEITQVYIPDIRGKAFRALKIIRQKIVTSDNFRYLAI